MKESYEVPSVRFSHGSGSVSENEMPHGWRTSLRASQKVPWYQRNQRTRAARKTKGGTNLGRESFWVTDSRLREG
jgi:hypothetical protein